MVAYIHGLQQCSGKTSVYMHELKPILKPGEYHDHWCLVSLSRERESVVTACTHLLSTDVKQLHHHSRSPALAREHRDATIGPALQLQKDSKRALPPTHHCLP